MENKISVCMVVRNEGKLLEKALGSIALIADEIIFIHDGPCLDNSLEIAQKYHAIIFVEPQSGEIERLRILALERSHYNWILQLDADEFLDEKAIATIPTLIQSKTIDAYTFKWPIPYGEKYATGPLSFDTKTILLRKSQMYFLGIIHEAPKSYGKEELRLDLILEHMPLYNNYTFHQLFNKWFTWDRLLANEIIHIETQLRYHIEDDALILQHYKRIRSHPLIRIIKNYILKDMFKKIINGELLFANLEVKKIYCIRYIHFFYLALQIAQKNMQHES